MQISLGHSLQFERRWTRTKVLESARRKDTLALSRLGLMQETLYFLNPSHRILLALLLLCWVVPDILQASPFSFPLFLLLHPLYLKF